jgi:hypothetical protein
MATGSPVVHAARPGPSSESIVNTSASGNPSGQWPATARAPLSAVDPSGRLLSHVSFVLTLVTPVRSDP